MHVVVTHLRTVTVCELHVLVACQMERSAQISKFVCSVESVSARWCVCGGGGGSDDGIRRQCLSIAADACTELGGRTPGSKLPASPPPLPRPDGG